MSQQGLIQLSLRVVGEVGRHLRAILLGQMLVTRYTLKVLLAPKVHQQSRRLYDDTEITQYRAQISEVQIRPKHVIEEHTLSRNPWEGLDWPHILIVMSLSKARF